VNALADKMCKLMNDKTLRVSMSQAGLKNVQRFGIEHVAEQWSRIFESKM
jgi:glycosyltransferase involved in cell wall biosynthesis